MRFLCIAVCAISLSATGAFAQCSDCDGDGYAAPQDCNDLDPTVHPGAPEVCDGRDNDCDGVIDPLPLCASTCSSSDLSGVDVRVTQTPTESYPHAMAWNGTEHAIVWSEFEGSTIRNLFFARLGATGLKQGDPQRLTSTFTVSTAPAIAWGPGEYGVVWGDNRDGNFEVYFARVSVTGQKLGGDVRVTNDPALSLTPRIVWTGSEYGVAWLDYRANSRGDVYFVRLNALGQRLGGDILVTPEPHFHSSPALVWTGSGYGLVWEDDRDSGPTVTQSNSEIYFARLDATGAKIGADVRVSNALEASVTPTLAWTGSEYGVAWFDYRDGVNVDFPTGQPQDVFFTLLAASGQRIAGEIRVDPDSANSVFPSLVWTGGEFGLAWRDSLNGVDNPNVYFARYDGQGVRLGVPLRVANPNSPNSSNSPLVVWTGKEYDFSWEDHRDGNTEVYFTRLTCGGCPDLDGDGFACSDCDDTRADVHPGAIEVCDGVDQNCNGLVDEGTITCGIGACSRTVPMCAGGQPQTCVPWPPTAERCDGIDNNCNGLTDEDVDGDGYGVCFDCNDANASINPGAVEICNSVDDNCNGLIDEDGFGVDSDTDGVRNACDNCVFAYNPTQADTDKDRVGNACDNCLLVANPDQADVDSDLLGDACDNCPQQYNPSQTDSDRDTVGDVCDNCILDPNPDQGDVDGDLEGNVCDLDDGLIWITLPDSSIVSWQQEVGFDSFNWYRGDLSVLRSSGLYTQDPSKVPLAARSCDLMQTSLPDGPNPGPGRAVFYLVSGNAGGVEGSLGTNSAGVVRTNTNPCP